MTIDIELIKTVKMITGLIFQNDCCCRLWMTILITADIAIVAVMITVYNLISGSWTKENIPISDITLANQCFEFI